MRILKSLNLPWIYNLWNPLYGEAPSDFEEDLNPIDEEKNDDDEHQARVAAIEDVTVELMVLKKLWWLVMEALCVDNYEIVEVWW